MDGEGVVARGTLAERVAALLPRIEYRRASTGEDLEAIFRLRYECYRREGAIEERAARRLDDPFDAVPNAHQLAVLLDGQLAACLRVHVATAAHPRSPAVDAFPDFLLPRLARGDVIVDCNRFMVDFSASRRCPELPFATLRIAYMASVHFNADLATATVRKEHMPFYRRELLMFPACEPRPYPMLTKLIGLMLIEFKQTGAGIERRRPFYASTPGERARLFGTAPAHVHAREVRETALAS